MIAEVERFLLHEAAVLDASRLDEWLDLFEPDGVYWIPIDPDSDPDRVPSIAYDDAVMRLQRVRQLQADDHYAQTPASRTVHYVSNVTTTERNDGVLVAQSALLVAEHRPGSPVRFLAGHVEHELVGEPQALRIRRKTVRLLDRDGPLHNLSFIL